MESTARLLALLSILSSRPAWSGAELADRLQVTERTIRRDVDRLRSLEYTVDSTGGTGGGYRLRSGSEITPLFLDEDEAIAIVAALLVAIADQSTGMVDGSTRALGKLHQMLPARLIRTVAAIQQAATAVALDRSPQVDPRDVALLAESCRNGIIVRFNYRSRADESTERRVEPNAIVTVRGVWYVIAFDLDRADWRLFRVDRMRDLVATGHGSTPRPLPGGDAMAFLGRSLAAIPYEHVADVEIEGSVDQLRLVAPWVNEARVDHHGDRCVVHLGADAVADVAGDVVRLVGAADVRSIEATPDVHAHLARVGQALVASRPDGPAHVRRR